MVKIISVLGLLMLAGFLSSASIRSMATHGIYNQSQTPDESVRIADLNARMQLKIREAREQGNDGPLDLAQISLDVRKEMNTR